MKLQYRTINLRSVKGFERAEKLQRLGWVVAQVGWDTIALKRGTK